MTPREKVERILDVRRRSVSWLATRLGESKQNVFNWLNKPDSARNADAWAKIAQELNVTVKQLLDPEEPLPGEYGLYTEARRYAASLPLGESLLELLLDILQNPDETDARKEIARATIREWIRESRR